LQEVHYSALVQGLRLHIHYLTESITKIWVIFRKINIFIRAMLMKQTMANGYIRETILKQYQLQETQPRTKLSLRTGKTPRQTRVKWISKDLTGLNITKLNSRPTGILSYMINWYCVRWENLVSWEHITLREV